MYKVVTVLDDMQNRDDNIYRVIFESDPTKLKNNKLLEIILSVINIIVKTIGITLKS